MSLDANYCTIELSTGALIEIDLEPQQVRARIRQGVERFAYLPLRVQSNKSDADYRKEMLVVREQVIAIYPLDERPQPQDRVTLSRSEAAGLV